MVTGNINDPLEQHESDINDCATTAQQIFQLENSGNDPLISTTTIAPVTKVAVPQNPTRENVAQQFQLNKNQRAAFMIIAGHLDGSNGLIDGTCFANES